MIEFQKELSGLRENYISIRNSDFNHKEFLALIITYPSLLVAAADDHFDEKEQELLISLVIGLLEEFNGTDLVPEEIASYEVKYLAEYSYLIHCMPEWKEKFLSFLLLFSNQELIEIQSTIKRMLVDVAEISAGISDKEKDVIDFINSTYLT